MITSGKGGVGKTTITATLGVAMASSGAKVAVVDADVGLNNLDLVLGVENKVVYDVTDVVKGRCRLNQALIKHPFCERLSLLSSRALSGGELSATAFAAVVTALRQAFDYVLVDCPAGIDVGFHRALANADEAIIVTTPVPAAVRDADKVVNLLSAYMLRRVDVVVNRVRGDLVLRGDMMSVGDIAEVLRLPIAGSVPEDDDVLRSATVGKITDSNSAHYTAVCMVADHVMRGSNRIYDCTERYKGIRGFIRKFAR